MANHQLCCSHASLPLGVTCLLLVGAAKVKLSGCSREMVVMLYPRILRRFSGYRGIDRLFSVRYTVQVIFGA